MAFGTRGGRASAERRGIQSQPSQRLRFTLGWPVSMLATSIALASAAASACGGDTFGGGEGGEGAGTGAGGSDSGGSGGTASRAECTRNDDCVAAANFDDPCFTPSCSSPVARREDDVATDPCLVPWDDRAEPVPEQCGQGEVACPAICAEQPACIAPRCDDGVCKLALGYDALECDAIGGTGGSLSADCSALLADLDEAIREARVCTPGGIVPECDGSTLLTTECGCKVLGNENLPERVVQAEAALEAFEESCDEPAHCQVTICPLTMGTPSCTSPIEDPTVGACQYGVVETQ